MKPTFGFRKVPSVLGGNRPQARDAGRDAFQRVQYLKAEVKTAAEKLRKASESLAFVETELEVYRQACNNCGDCSACCG